MPRLDFAPRRRPALPARRLGKTYFKFGGELGVSTPGPAGTDSGRLYLRLRSRVTPAASPGPHGPACPVTAAADDGTIILALMLTDSPEAQAGHEVTVVTVRLGVTVL